MTDTMPLLKTLSDIRIKSGVNEKPMLDELADAVISKVRKDTLLEIAGLAKKQSEQRFSGIDAEGDKMMNFYYDGQGEALFDFAQELERMAGE